MTDEPPTPRSELPSDVVDTFDGYSPEHLRRVARYAEELADHKEWDERPAAEAEGPAEATGETKATQATRAEEPADDAEDGVGERPDSPPDDVPSKATITIKEINDNRYYYWQWRDGDRVRSAYHAPVNPDD